jgi:hypothetical protein
MNRTNNAVQALHHETCVNLQGNVGCLRQSETFNNSSTFSINFCMGEISVQIKFLQKTS